MRAFSLCYHRILEPTAAEAWPYFERGTAVSPDSFVRQLEALRASFEFSFPGRPRSSARPPVWLTFDDGYRDLARFVVPHAERLGFRGTVFVSTCTLRDDATALPADRWFSALTSAKRTRFTLSWGERERSFDLRDAEDRRRLVHGPERRAFLLSDPKMQAHMLEELVDALGATTRTPRDLYLCANDVKRLVARGWEIGSHGASHRLFTTLTDAELCDELDSIDDTFETLALPKPTTFAWPDGVVSSSAARVLHARGYQQLAALGDAPFDINAAHVSRYLVGDDPEWIERTLLPLL